MKLKNNIILLTILVVVLIILGILIRQSKLRYKDDELSLKDVSPINTQIDLEEIFREIDKIAGIGNRNEIYEMNISGNNTSDIENKIGIEDKDFQSKQSNPEDEIDFGKYEGLEMKAIVNTTDNEVNEVWMIKLGNINQQEDVCRILGRRIQKLKNAFREDEAQTRILNEAVIKQEDGIVIMIISPNDNDIEKTIGNIMSEK